MPRLRQAQLQSPEGQAARGQRLADPIVVMSRCLALLGSRHKDALTIATLHLSRRGQPVLGPPSVKGWPVNEEWLPMRRLLARRLGMAALAHAHPSPGG